LVNCASAGLKEGKKLSGEAASSGFRPWFPEILEEISPSWQANSVQMRLVIPFKKRSQLFIGPHNETLSGPDARP
jgi:hypothetical protein